jgi:hypothetical protein
VQEPQPERAHTGGLYATNVQTRIHHLTSFVSLAPDCADNVQHIFSCRHKCIHTHFQFAGMQKQDLHLILYRKNNTWSSKLQDGQQWVHSDRDL